MADRFVFTLDSVEAVMVGTAVNADVRRFPLRIRNTTIDPVRFTKLAVLVREELERRGLVAADTVHPLVRTGLELFSVHQVSVSVTGRIGAIGGPGAGGPGAGLGGGSGGASVPDSRGGFGPIGGGGGPSVGAVPPGTPQGGPGVSGGGGGSAARGAFAPMGGAGGAGAGGGQSDDMEHQFADYLEGDSELFAPGRVVSPPVIGDWKSKEDWK